MARSFILGGVSATGLATGKPYIRRITRVGGNSTAVSPDGLNCAIDADGDVSFRTDAPEVDGNRKPWNAGTGGDGELLFVEFPSTTRTLSVQLEAAETVADNTPGANNDNIRLKVMLTAPNQVVQALDSQGQPIAGATDIMQPITNGNFIEIARGEVATINARTKGVFILIQNFAASSTFNDNDSAAAPAITAGLTQGADATTLDCCSILVTAVLDHEGFQGSNGVQTGTKSAGNVAGTLNKIWPLSTNDSNGVG